MEGTCTWVRYLMHPAHRCPPPQLQHALTPESKSLPSLGAAAWRKSPAAGTTAWSENRHKNSIAQLAGIRSGNYNLKVFSRLLISLFVLFL